MADLEEVALDYRRAHGRRMRVATKYLDLTRGFFARQGVTGYRIVESRRGHRGRAGGRRGRADRRHHHHRRHPAANGLKMLDDGVILKSQANLIASKAAAWSPDLDRLARAIAAKLRA